MNNEEKEHYILDILRLYNKIRPYDGCNSFGELKKNDDFCWDLYNQLFINLIPKSFFKYRKPTENAFKNLENDEAWFSFPKDFDDTVDSTINNNIENDLHELYTKPNKVIIKISKGLIRFFASSLGLAIDEQMLAKDIPLFKENGDFNEEEMKQYLRCIFPLTAADDCLSRFKNIIEENNKKILLNEVEGYLNYYLDFNKNVKKGLLIFSLAEEYDNQAMWGLYAEESKGFCIEYEFPKENFLAQRMLLNLFPIYYGEKPLINFIDIFVRGLYAEHQKYGISDEDKEKWQLSAYTKDKTYEFQKEWRIALIPLMGGNCQKFPFAKSIILGERITDANKQRLIDIAKRKNLDLYIRRIDLTGSKIITEKVSL